MASATLENRGKFSFAGENRDRCTSYTVELFFSSVFGPDCVGEKLSAARLRVVFFPVSAIWVCTGPSAGKRMI
jgi:hypothetical protein